MVKNLVFTIYSIAFVGIIFLLPENAVHFSLILNPYLFDQVNLNETHSIINLLYNSYHQWSFDPVITSLLKLFPESQYHAYFVLYYCLTFFIAGLYLLFNYFNKNKNLSSFICLVIFLITFFAIWKFDIVLISSLTWLPLYILSILNLEEAGFRKKSSTFILITLSATALILSANQLAFIYILVPLLLNVNLLKKYKLLFLVLFILASLHSILFTSPEFADFDTSARFLANDTIPGNSRPVFGPDSPVQFQNLDIQRAIFVWITLLILLFIFYLLRVNTNKSRENYVLVILALCLLLDTIFPDYIAHIFPVETLTRIIPNLFFFALLPITCFLVTLSVSLVLLKKSKSIFVLFCIGLYLTSNVAAFLNPELQKNIEKISKINTEASLYTNSYYFRVLNSPSAAILLNNKGIDTLKIQLEKKKKFRSLTPYIHELRDYKNTSQTLLKELISKNATTRWYSGNGEQTGKEKLFVSLNQQLSIRALKILTGVYASDFPRALRVSASKECPTNYFDYKTYDVFEEFKPWLGSITFTKLGFPYYTNERLVKVFFDQAITVRCILIEQIGKSDNYDWSITHLRALFAQDPKASLLVSEDPSHELSKQN